MCCSGEVDITRSRWSEKPTVLIPMILSNINNLGPDAHRIKFKQGLLGAKQQEQELLRCLEQLPDGKGKVKKAKKMIRVMRNLIGCREYPKYGFIKRYYVCKTALLKEADKLVQNKVIREKVDIFIYPWRNSGKSLKQTAWITASSKRAKQITRSMRN